MIANLLQKYIDSPEDYTANWNLAVEYHSQGQTASAVSFYIRASERTDNDLNAYECLLQAAICLMEQENRGVSTKGLLLRAATLMPTRPEAYFLLSLVMESEQYYQQRWAEAYSYASLAYSFSDNDKPPLKKQTSYLNSQSAAVQKGHCAWQAGITDEARQIFEDLNLNSGLLDQYKQIVKNNLDYIISQGSHLHPVYKKEPNEFDWGPIANHKWFVNRLSYEIFDEDVYQKFYKIQADDVIVDIGASVGPFIYKIKDSKAKRAYLVEPDVNMVPALKENLKDLQFPYELDVCAITSKDGEDEIKGILDLEALNTHSGKAVTVPSMTFKSFIDKHSITYIDFLKTDSEGAEYDIFTEENLPWIKSNVKRIAGEWHLGTPELKEKFRAFRDLYLRHFPRHEIYSADGVNIKQFLWSDWFLEYYTDINVYIQNQFSAKTKEPNLLLPSHTETKGLENKWQYSTAPTMEITTIIPEKGCVVDCVFCPQRVLVEEFKGNRRFSLDNYKKLIDKIPQEVRITFAGFTEPWLHSQCTDMLEYAHAQGHPVSVFTTAIGMSLDDVERIKDIPYAGNPNGGFTLHLPDAEYKAKHPITENYIKVIERFGKLRNSIQNFSVMSMGTVHPDVKHVFGTAINYEMWSRAGNLHREKILKPELDKYKYKYVDHGDDAKVTCGCDERLYHNILLPNGDVSLCCMDYSMDGIIGNLNTQSYNEVIPDPYSMFDMCKLCENAVPIDSDLIVNERKAYGI